MTNFYLLKETKSLIKVVGMELEEKYQITRNNVGWYQHIENQHKIFINNLNILGLKEIVESGIIKK